MAIQRAVSVKELQSKRFNSMPFDGEFEACFGRPERTGCWIIYGPPANGKTRFSVRLSKYMTRFGRVVYDSIEEGLSLSLQEAFIAEEMEDVEGRIQLLDKEPIDDLVKRLKKQRSPDIVFIDSLQFTFKTYAQLKKIIDENPRKLFVFISHSEGKQPAGRVGKAIEYLSNVKIRVEAFKAFAKSRYGGGEPYTIWEEGAARYW